MKAIPVLTIDGPSGSGKGTVARECARVLGWHLLDSGALYRAVALAALRHVKNYADNEALVLERLLASRVEFIDREDQEPLVLLDGEEVGAALRTETCAAAASTVAAMPSVRAALLQKQRDYRRSPGLVADGRDMGTVVFADAEIKVFLTASAEERAQRRYKQLNEKGFLVTFPGLLDEIRARDERDSNRPIAPLRPAIEAFIIDSSHLAPQAVVELVLERVKAALSA
jgi:CMP/dCMP kinase